MQEVSEAMSFNGAFIIAVEIGLTKKGQQRASEIGRYGHILCCC